MICQTTSVAQSGSQYILTKVESSISNGIPDFKIIGLADTVIKESSARVKNAIINSKLNFPTNKITINMLPANFSKKGSHFDLAIAISILQSTNQVKKVESDEYAFFGELSLSGDLVALDNLLPYIIEAESKKFKTIFIPKSNKIDDNIVKELMKNCKVIGASNLRDVVDYINGDVELTELNRRNKEVGVIEDTNVIIEKNSDEEWDWVLGQEDIKRAILISISGGHNMLMVGAPGVGKTVLAKMCRTIMPRLDYENALDVMKIYSLTDKSKHFDRDIFEAPFRNPKVNISNASMIGGGIVPKPGEVSLAHKGILFLDELPNFSREILKNLTQIMDEKQVSIIREKTNYVFPSDFILICAMNPCKCGYYGDNEHNCTCSQSDIYKYLQAITGALLDRIDIKIRVNRIEGEVWSEGLVREEFEKYNYEEKTVQNMQGCGKTVHLKNEKLRSTVGNNHHMSVQNMRDVVMRAREIQKNRNRMYKSKSEYRNYLNGSLEDDEIERVCNIGMKEMKFLRDAYEKLEMSHRGYKKVLRLSRTIADLDQRRNIEMMDIAEALQYRQEDII